MALIMGSKVLSIIGPCIPQRLHLKQLDTPLSIKIRKRYSAMRRKDLGLPGKIGKQDLKQKDERRRG